jgi:hypothetical protein
VAGVTRRYTVRYGHDGGRFRYVHSHHVDRKEAEDEADRWLRGGGWGDTRELRVWVEDEKGKVVYGQEAVRHDA